MIDDVKQVLDHVFYGNTVLQYLHSLLVWFLLTAVIFSFKYLFVRLLSKWEVSLGLGSLRYLKRMITSLNLFVLIWFAFYLSVHVLDQSKKFTQWIDKISITVGILQITSLLAMITGVFIQNLRFGRSSNDKASDSIKSNMSIIAKTGVWVAGLLFLLSNLGVDVSTFVAGLGVGGIAVALAAQTILGDTFSSFSINIDKPFEVGDDIMVEDFRGIVERIGLKTTRVRSLNGELLIFPNSYMTGAKIRNYQHLFERRILVRIGLLYETPKEKLKQFPSALKNMVESFEGVRFDRANFVEFGDSALIFELVYFVENKDFKVSIMLQEKINFKIWDYMAENGLSMAYPTRTVYMTESKN